MDIMYYREPVGKNRIQMQLRLGNVCAGILQSCVLEVYAQERLPGMRELIPGIFGTMLPLETTFDESWGPDKVEAFDRQAAEKIGLALAVNEIVLVPMG